MPSVGMRHLHRAGAKVSILKHVFPVFFSLRSRFSRHSPSWIKRPSWKCTCFVLAGFVGYQIITTGAGAAAHAADVGHQRHLRHFAGRLARRGRRPIAADSARFWASLAVTAATINVVGGFMITDRMLKMFKRQERK